MTSGFGDRNPVTLLGEILPLNLCAGFRAAITLGLAGWNTQTLTGFLPGVDFRVTARSSLTPDP